MRYTTIIDISAIPTIYKNIHCRTLYLHMCLTCGYHDEDRDLYDRSIRSLAADCGLTVSAVRHSLKLLERSGLIRKDGPAWIVTKWIPRQEITPRPEPDKKDLRQTEAVRIREQAQEERDREAAERQRLAEQGRSPFIDYCENLKKKAASGDLEAQAAFERHRAAYEQAVRNFAQK